MDYDVEYDAVSFRFSPEEKDNLRRVALHMTAQGRMRRPKMIKAMRKLIQDYVTLHSLAGKTDDAPAEQVGK